MNTPYNTILLHIPVMKAIGGDKNLQGLINLRHGRNRSFEFSDTFEI